MPTLVLEGTVFSGKGEGKKFIQLPWVTRQIETKLGFSPYPGTLNICLTPESIEKKKLLQNARQLEITPEKEFCKGFLIEAKIGKSAVAIVLPQTPNYPKDTIELIAPSCLRKLLGLVDGGEVAVSVSIGDCKPC